MNSKTKTDDSHIPTARESEAAREQEWETYRKSVSPNLNKKARLVDQTGVSVGTREDQHENADRVGRGDKPETPLNPASHAAEDQTERSHSKGVTDLASGAVHDRKTKKSQATSGRHVVSTGDGLQEVTARHKHVKSVKASNDEVFTK